MPLRGWLSVGSQPGLGNVSTLWRVAVHEGSHVVGLSRPIDLGVVELAWERGFRVQS